MVRSVDSFCFNQKFVGAFILRGLMGSHVCDIKDQVYGTILIIIIILDDFSPEDASIVKLKAVLDSKVTTSFAAEN